jgi:molybdate transport system substrate-binding protein
MATRRALAELAMTFTSACGLDVSVTSIGGVEAARRIRAGDSFDIVVLAREALSRLAEDGFVAAESITMFARSPTALAVRKGAPRPAACDDTALQLLVRNARTIGVSSGPSGALVRKLVDRWRASGAIDLRLVEAPPGVPVARLIADGGVDVGFQQLSELLGEPGIDVIGSLPATLAPLTFFAAGCTIAAQTDVSAASLLRHLTSAHSAPVLERYGLRAP